MAKSKHRSNHNQSRKVHRNGFTKPKRTDYTSTKGMNVKVLQNVRNSRKFAMAKRIEAKKAAAAKTE
ncbi:60S ribosomal protein L29 [Entamoeba marina]